MNVVNVEIGTVVEQLLFCDYLFRIFSIGSLQCELQVWYMYQTPPRILLGGEVWGRLDRLSIFLYIFPF